MNGRTRTALKRLERDVEWIHDPERRQSARTALVHLRQEIEKLTSQADAEPLPPPRG